MKKLLIVFGLLVAFTACNAFADSIVANGGFETGDFSGWTLASTTCTGVGGNIAQGNPGCLNAALVDPGPYSGNFAAYLGFSGVADDTLTQALATTPGSTYTLDFWLANIACNGNSGCGGLGNTTPNDFSVSWNGTTIYSVANVGAFGYTELKFSNLLATGPATNLTFSFNNTPVDFVLDDVSVTATPEPATLALLSAGIFGVGALRRKLVR